MAKENPMNTEASALAGLPPTGKLLGLDLGTKTIGVAISDSMRYSATPLETIARTKFTAAGAAAQHGRLEGAAGPIHPRLRP
jgi:putative holliday junction resolvase